MSDQPVTPDREALIAVSMGAVERAWDSLPSDRYTLSEEEVASVSVDALLPLLTEALDRARQQGEERGRNEMTRKVVDWLSVGGFALVEANLSHLARGGPNRKDEE